MLRFYYNPAYKYTNRTIIDVSSDISFRELDYENIDSPDTINGHIIYQLEAGEKVPTYIVDTVSNWRWFVSGITQLRTGKFQISLIRDIVSQGLEWTQEQAYVEAGTATDFCKYKKWGLPFTNTKVGSKRLNFWGKSSFFVFYVNEQDDNNGSGPLTEKDLEIKCTTLPSTVSYFDEDLSDLNDIPYFSYVGAGPIRSWENLKGTVNMEMTYSSMIPSLYYKNITFDNQNYPNSFNVNVSEGINENYLHTPIYYSLFNNSVKQAISNCMESFLNSYRSSIGSAQSQLSINTLDAYVDKILRVEVSPGVYHFYIINRDRQTINHNDLLTNAQTESFTTLLRGSSAITAASKSPYIYGNVGTGHFYFQSTENISTYTLQDLGVGSSFDYKFKSNVYKLPKSSVRCVNIVADSDFSNDTLMQTLMLCITNPNIADTDNVGRILDVQYLPFSLATTKNSDFTINGTSLTAQFIDIDDLYFAKTEISSDPQTINKETDSIYIVSPSRKSQFKFSPYNNDGRMEFDIQVTLKPYQSVIYVRPTTKGLLLQDWNDKDCLIIQEDFSLTKVDSAWTNYVYNNRNFQNAFNLQVQTKEFERNWERRIEQEQAKSDEWNARNLSAQKAQTYTGNLPIISSIASAIGTSVMDEKYMAAAALDREYNEALYQKSMEVARQQFSYQIDNIKSQPLIPNTITAIDCKTLDGIYLEYYSTNETELNSIAQFYKYNGNRIDNYGTFATYWGPFIRGKIIISDNYTQPEIDELNRRLELGIFTGGITL